MLVPSVGSELSGPGLRCVRLAARWAILWAASAVTLFALGASDILGEPVSKLGVTTLRGFGRDVELGRALIVVAVVAVLIAWTAPFVLGCARRPGTHRAGRHRRRAAGVHRALRPGGRPRRGGLQPGGPRVRGIAVGGWTRRAAVGRGAHAEGAGLRASALQRDRPLVLAHRRQLRDRERVGAVGRLGTAGRQLLRTARPRQGAGHRGARRSRLVDAPTRPRRTVGGREPCGGTYGLRSGRVRRGHDHGGRDRPCRGPVPHTDAGATQQRNPEHLRRGHPRLRRATADADPAADAVATRHPRDHHRRHGCLRVPERRAPDASRTGRLAGRPDAVVLPGTRPSS